MANILIADKDGTMRELLDVALKRSDHETQLAEDGHQVLDFIRQEKFDLAIIDYTMPGISALEILHDLRENGDEIPQIMILSSKSTSDSIRESIEAGARDYVVKPFNLPVLVERVEILLHK